jgi:hypothetical protein
MTPPPALTASLAGTGEDTMHADQAPPADRRARPLTDHETAAVIGTAVAVAGLALIGFANSFMAVTAAARPSFGPLAPTVPLGIDLGIAVFAALDLVLARLDMRPRWVRLVPWALTLATIALNVAPEHTWFGRVAHAVLPGIWVLAVEAGAHVIRVRAGLAAGTAMDRIRRSRWLLAPWSTAGLWRRMVLWEVRSYPVALQRERDRVLARTAMQDQYGLLWRVRAPRRDRALYRLGELAPAAAVPAVPVPAVPGLAGVAVPAVAARRPARRAAGGRKPRRVVPDVEALMPLGWQIAADLAGRGVALTRDSLAAALREAGQPSGNARTGALLARLRAGAPADPADRATPTPGRVTALAADGGTRDE